MRGDRGDGGLQRPLRRPAIAGMIAAVLLSSWAAACRSAGASARIDPDRAWQAAAGPAANTEIAALPEGAAKALVTERCLLCHGAGLITQQRKDAAAWGRTLTQMRTWGTPIQDEDQTALIAYLTDHFGPASKPR